MSHYGVRSLEQEPIYDLSGYSSVILPPNTFIKNGNNPFLSRADLLTQVRWFSIQDARPPLANGAIGDGVTNDSPAIAATLLAAANAGGGLVWAPAPPVAYLINQTHFVGTNVRLAGEGRASLFRVAANSNLTTIFANASNYNAYNPITRTLTQPGVGSIYNVFDSTVANNFNTIGASITGIAIDGNGANQTAGINHGITFNGNAYGNIDDVFVSNLFPSTGGQAYAVYYRNCSFSTISRVRAFSVGAGVLLDLACFEIAVSDCVVYASKDTPFAAVGVGGASTPIHCAWNNCLAVGVATGTYASISAGFDLAGCTLQSLSNCRSVNAFHHGFEAHTNLGSQASYLNLTNCQAYRCGVGTGFSGIAINPAQHISLTGCGADQCDSGLSIASYGAGQTTDINVVGGQYVNSLAGPGINISVGAPPASALRLRFVGVVSNDSKAVPTQTYGFQNFGTANDVFDLIGCSFSPNLTGAFNFGATPIHLTIVGNGADGLSEATPSQPFEFFQNAVKVQANAVIYSGAAVPAFAAVSGDMYLRRGGGPGTRLYINGGAAVWNAVAGV